MGGTKKTKKARTRGKKKAKTASSTSKTPSKQQPQARKQDENRKEEEDPTSPDSAEKIKGSASEESIDLTDPDFLHFLLVRELELFEEKMTKKVDYLAHVGRTVAYREDDTSQPEDDHVPWDMHNNNDINHVKPDDTSEGRVRGQRKQQEIYVGDDATNSTVIEDRMDKVTSGRDEDERQESPVVERSKDSQSIGPKPINKPGSRAGDKAQEKEVKKTKDNSVSKKDMIRELSIFPKIDKELRSSAASASSFASGGSGMKSARHLSVQDITRKFSKKSHPYLSYQAKLSPRAQSFVVSPTSGVAVRKQAPVKVSREELRRHAEATQRLFEGRGARPQKRDRDIHAEKEKNDKNLHKKQEASSKTVHSPRSGNAHRQSGSPHYMTPIHHPGGTHDFHSAMDSNGRVVDVDTTIGPHPPTQPKPRKPQHPTSSFAPPSSFSRLAKVSSAPKQHHSVPISSHGAHFMTPTHHQGDVHAFHSALDSEGKIVDVPAHTHSHDQNGHKPSPTFSVFDSEDEKPTSLSSSPSIIVKSQVGNVLTLQIDTSCAPSSTADVLNVNNSIDDNQTVENDTSPASGHSKSLKSIASFNMQSVPWHELTQEEKEERRERARKRALQRESSTRLSSSITRSSFLTLLENEDEDAIQISPRARAQARADQKYKEMMKPRELAVRRNVHKADPRVGRYHSNKSSPKTTPRPVNEKEALLMPHPPVTKKLDRDPSSPDGFTAVSHNTKSLQFRNIEKPKNESKLDDSKTPSYAHLRTARDQNSASALVHSKSSPTSNVSSPKSRGSPTTPMKVSPPNFMSPKSRGSTVTLSKTQRQNTNSNTASSSISPYGSCKDKVVSGVLANHRFKELSRVNQYHALNVNTSAIPAVLQYIETMKNRLYHVGEPKYTADPPRRLQIEWKKDVLDKLLLKDTPQLHFHILPTIYRNHNANVEIFVEKFDLYHTKKGYRGDQFLFEPNLNAETITARYCYVPPVGPKILTRQEREAKEREERDKRRLSRSQRTPRRSYVEGERKEMEEKEGEKKGETSNEKQGPQFKQNMTAIIFTKTHNDETGSFQLVNAEELQDYLNDPKSLTSNIDPETIDNYNDGSHDDAEDSFIQILHGCKKPQVLLLSFKHMKQSKHGYDNEVNIEKVPFTKFPPHHNHEDINEEQEEKVKKFVKNSVKLDGFGDMSIMNMNSATTTNNSLRVKKVDFDKFSVLAAENSAQLISDMTAFLKSSLYGHNKAKDTKSHAPNNFKIIKFKVYFIIDTENFDRMFLHHFYDIHVTGNPHWPPSSDDKIVDQ